MLLVPTNLFSVHILLRNLDRLENDKAVQFWGYSDSSDSHSDLASEGGGFGSGFQKYVDKLEREKKDAGSSSIS